VQSGEKWLEIKKVRRGEKAYVVNRDGELGEVGGISSDGLAVSQENGNQPEGTQQ
jgi:hypothetical protein